jgi:hypothetical protein
LDEPLERSAQPEADAEPEHQERSAMAKLTALRERLRSLNVSLEEERLLRGAVASEEPLPRADLEERLRAALGRSVDLLEERLDSSGGGRGYELSDHAFAVRNIAETLDRLGLLKPPPPPVEAPEPDVNEVWAAAGESGLSTYEADRLVARLRERYEGRA